MEQEQKCTELQTNRSKNIEFIALCTERINDLTIQGKFTDEQLEYIASILSQITI